MSRMFVVSRSRVSGTVCHRTVVNMVRLPVVAVTDISALLLRRERRWRVMPGVFVHCLMCRDC